MEQVPESGVLHGAGDELGEFVFIKVNVKVKGVPKEKVKVLVNVESDDKVGIEAKTEVISHDNDTSPMLLPLPTL